MTSKNCGNREKMLSTGHVQTRIAAEKLGVSIPTVITWAKEGRIPATVAKLVGHEWYFVEEGLTDLNIESGKTVTRKGHSKTLYPWSCGDCLFQWQGYEVETRCPNCMKNDVAPVVSYARIKGGKIRFYDGLSEWDKKANEILKDYLRDILEITR